MEQHVMPDTTGRRIGLFNVGFVNNGSGGGAVPSNAYVAEDGSTPYVAEDGSTVYVTES